MDREKHFILMCNATLFAYFHWNQLYLWYTWFELKLSFKARFLASLNPNVDSLFAILLSAGRLLQNDRR